MPMIDVPTTAVELCPAGTYVGRCCRLVDMGTQLSTYQGTERSRRVLSLSFEILDDEVRRSDGEPFLLSRRFTFSFHEKAGLRQLMETWLQRPMTNSRQFDTDEVIGRYGLVTVNHTTRNDATYANVATVVPLPRGMAKPGPVSEALVYGVSVSSDDVLARLPEKMQEAIKSSPEYAVRSKGAPRSAAKPASKPADDGYDDFDPSQYAPAGEAEVEL